MSEIPRDTLSATGQSKYDARLRALHHVASVSATRYYQQHAKIAQKEFKLEETCLLTNFRLAAQAHHKETALETIAAMRRGQEISADTVKAERELNPDTGAVAYCRREKEDWPVAGGKRNFDILVHAKGTTGNFVLVEVSGASVTQQHTSHPLGDTTKLDGLAKRLLMARLLRYARIPGELAKKLAVYSQWTKSWNTYRMEGPQNVGVTWVEARFMVAFSLDDSAVAERKGKKTRLSSLSNLAKSYIDDEAVCSERSGSESDLSNLLASDADPDDEHADKDADDEPHGTAGNAPPSSVVRPSQGSSAENEITLVEQLEELTFSHLSCILPANHFSA
ncbi:hypothetical protein BDZ88DRAFT_491753 [Geranomyces variabilis]|nr:hypothetical protein BDZ88DRAFT_491753 [Geranomyces variabilis]